MAAVNLGATGKTGKSRREVVKSGGMFIELRPRDAVGC
jgi:hypothetical protein